MKKSPFFKRFLRRKSSVIGLVVLALFFLIAILGPFLVGQDPLQQNPKDIHQGPTSSHIMGTDYLGRDTFSRIVHGARLSIALSFSGVISGAIIGIILGLLAGYFGGIVDAIISRIIDVLLAFPGLLLAMVIVAILGPGLVNTAIAISVFSIPSIARMVRGVVISLRESQYIDAAKVAGASSGLIIFSHILPNCASQILVNITLNLGTAILTSSTLSFLGLGVQPPAPEWGAMLSTAREALRNNPSEAIFPGIAITLVVMSFSLVGDGLRDALDPRLKNV